MFDSVSSVLNVFAKLIERLEKIKQRQQDNADKKYERINTLKVEVVQCESEITAADKAIAKLKVFTDE